MAFNNITWNDPYEIQPIRDVIRFTQGLKWFSVLDLREAFYYVEIEEREKHKTAFEFDGTIYEWNGMLMR